MLNEEDLKEVFERMAAVDGRTPATRSTSRWPGTSTRRWPTRRRVTWCSKNWNNRAATPSRCRTPGGGM